MITPMGTEFDKLGNEVNILHSTALALSPVYTFFLRHTAKLIDDGFAFPVTNWEDKNCGAIYATDDNGKVLGHIVYSTEYIEQFGHLWIVLSAVEDHSRGRGIYTIMHKYFEQLAKDMGCWSIASYVHKNNKVRLATAEKVGLLPAFHIMGKKI